MQARPFEDTPNGVLRRVAQLDPSAPRKLQVTGTMGDQSNPRPPLASSPGFSGARTRLTGGALNRRYHLNAAHALYHCDGTWYEKLRRFPGILCDPRGYLMYASESQFLSDTNLAIGTKVNVRSPFGIKSHPRYTLFPSVE